MSRPYWVLQYKRTSALKKNEEQAVMRFQYRVLRYWCTKQMKNKLWWVVRTEYYSTNVLAH